MQSEFPYKFSNSTSTGSSSDIDISKFDKIDTLSVLENVLNSFGTPVTREDFKKELNDYNELKINEVSKIMNNHVKNITKDEIEDCHTNIIAKVIKTNKNGTIDVIKPYDTDANNSWTNIPNPTIYRYLENGDEVVLSYYKKKQKSNCWVEFIKLSETDFEKKTIFKDINKIFDISDNILLLKKWIEKIKEEGNF